MNKSFHLKSGEIFSRTAFLIRLHTYMLFSPVKNAVLMSLFFFMELTLLNWTIVTFLKNLMGEICFVLISKG